MWKKVKKFYDKNEEVSNAIIIIFTILLTSTILVLIENHRYKNEYAELHTRYNDAMKSYEKCLLNNKIQETDMQHYIDYYNENNK